MAANNKRPRRRVRRVRSLAAPPRAEREGLICELELQLTEARLREQELRQTQRRVEEVSRYYSGLFNLAPVGYIVMDGVGRILEINQAGAALLRRNRAQMLRELFVRFVPKNALPDFLNHLRLAKTTRKQVVLELNLDVRSDVQIPIELVIAAYEGPDRITHYRAAIIDVTERQLVRQALQHTQQNYRDLVDSVEGIVWESNAGSREFTFVSQQAENILGYPVERWLREPDFWPGRIHVDDRERVVKAHREAIHAVKNFVVEFRAHTADRRVLWLRNGVTVSRAANGIIKLRGVMVNITGLKDAEEALREETRMLETINRIGTSLTAELDIENLIRLVTEAGKEVTGAEFGAFYYHKMNGHGEEKSFHSFGASQEVFDRLPLPQHRLLAPASETEKEAIRIDDLLDDPRCPKRHSHSRASRSAPAMRSYLAIPIASRRGEPLGGLLFGHSQPGAFTERAQHLLAGIASEAGIALENARLHETVSKSESRFRQLADAMPQIVWTAGMDGRVDYFNHRWYEFTGFPDGQLDESGWLSYLDPEEGRRCVEAWKRAVDSGDPFSAECRLLESKTGKYRWHLIRAVPVRDDRGRIVRWFGTATDIEDQKRVEEEVRDMNTSLERRVSERTAQLQASNQELEAFSYSVSHDLRAPLRSIDAFSQLVREDCADKLDEQARQYLGIVIESSRQMSRLIDDLLHLSRVTRSEIRRSAVDLGTLAQQVITGLRQLEPGRTVEVVIAPDLRAEGDERLLRIALENLLNNAWKFTSRQPQARIELGVELRAGKPVFFVRDNGAGFDMAFADKLFGAFQRLHSYEEFPGHGIGLATVQRIIMRHGGRIWANALVDQGATFYFTLPAQG